jgi:branched-chain amino acid transport system substrate-binding protein
MKRLAMVWCGVCLSVGCGENKKESRGQINIGVFISLAGITASQGPGWDAALKVAASEINAAGGVLNKDITFDVKDSQTDFNQTASPYSSELVAQQFLDAGERLWICSDGMNVPDHIAGKVQPPAVAVPEPLVLFTISGSDSVTTLDTTDMFFRTCGKNADTTKAAAYYAYSQGRRKVAIITATGYMTPSAQGFASSFTALGGSLVRFNDADYIAFASVANYANYDSDVATVMAQSPDAIYLSLALDPDGAHYIQALLNAGYAGQIYVDAMMTDITLFTKVTGNTDGIRGVLSGNPTARSQLAQKVEAVAGIQLVTTSRLGENYDAVYLMALAIAKAGSTDPAAVRDGLRAVAGPGGTIVGPGDFGRALQLIAAGTPINYEGVSGSLDFDANGDVSSVFDLWVTTARTFKSTGTWTPSAQ